MIRCAECGESFDFLDDDDPGVTHESDGSHKLVPAATLPGKPWQYIKPLRAAVPGGGSNAQ